MVESVAVAGDDRSFFNGPNVWVLIPLAGISIPIIRVLDDSDLAWFVGGVLLIVAVTLAVRNVIVLRHRHRMEELEAKQQWALAERERLNAIDLMLEREGVQDPTRRLDRPR
jgi:hypothetical protein